MLYKYLNKYYMQMKASGVLICFSFILMYGSIYNSPFIEEINEADITLIDDYNSFRYSSANEFQILHDINSPILNFGEIRGRPYVVVFYKQFKDLNKYLHYSKATFT